MDHGALEALVAILQRHHPLHMGGGDLQAGEDEGDGSLHHGLAPLGGEVPQHLLLWGGNGVASGVGSGSTIMPQLVQPLSQGTLLSLPVTCRGLEPPHGDRRSTVALADS